MSNNIFHFFPIAFVFSKRKKKRKNDKIRGEKILFFVFLIFILFFLLFNIIYFVKEHHQKYFDFSFKKNTIPIQKNNKEKIKYFGILIEKINLVAPIIQNVDGVNKNIYKKELKNGVAHLKGSSLPGQGSNVFIFGHSSSNFGSGKYSKVFARLNELERGDKIIIFYRNKEFHYYVFEKKVVKKTDLSVIQPTKEEQLTLMTCWPVGTADKRLIIKSSLVK